jgi:hypothetical protein
MSKSLPSTFYLPSSKPVLPTKEQRALLEFIGEFIATYGYSPSYREIRAGLSYGSVATIAKHVDNLVAKGLLTKRPGSARSLEPAAGGMTTPIQLKPKQTAGEKWLIDAIDMRFQMVEASAQCLAADIDHLTVLVASLKVLGLDAAYTAFSSRLNAITSS